MEIKNATITGVTLSSGDRGLLSSWVYLDYGNSGQAFGGYALYLPKSFKHHNKRSLAGHFIMRVLEVAGVDCWDKLVGKTVRERSDHSGIEAIGHITKDDWFNPSIDFSEVE